MEDFVFAVCEDTERSPLPEVNVHAEHDFFEMQPRTDAAVFLLRHIVHNWPDDYIVKVLRRLRDAAQPSTRLLVADQILPYACAVPDDRTDIPGATLPAVPKPLLANLGRVSSIACTMDHNMRSAYNSKERTLEEHIHVLESSGWRMERVNRVRGDRNYSHIIAAPDL